MIKINKLYIENFKGVSSAIRVDFSENDAKVNVLSGPNGFGKTTLFEAIEVCLTGEFKRVNFFDSVQKKTRDKKKPFFQNIVGKDVIIKLIVELFDIDQQTSTSYVIIKHFDDGSSPRKVKHGRENIPSDSSNFFRTYLIDDLAYFDSNDYSKLKNVLQTEIDELFYNKGRTLKLSNIFYLFNYIQQEDSIYFLKKDEDEKGNELSFLFNIEKEEQERNKLSAIYEHLKSKYEGIESKIEQLNETLSDARDIKYIQLFPEEDFNFDKEKPFEDVQDLKEKLGQFTYELSALIDFRRNFNRSEFEKYVHFNQLNKTIIDDNDFLEVLILKKLYSKELLDHVENQNKKIERVLVFLDRKDKTKIEKDFFDWFIPNESEGEYKRYQQFQNEISELDKDLGEIGKIISELISSRDRCIHDFEQLKKKEILSANNCPLCNSPFKSYQELLNEISKKTLQLKAYNDSKLESKKGLSEKIIEIAKGIENEASKFIAENPSTDNAVIIKLRSISNFEFRLAEAIKNYPEIDSKETEEIYFSSLPKSIVVIKEKAEVMKQFITETLLPKYKYDEQLILKKELYSRYFNDKSELFEKCGIDMLEKKLDYIKYRYKILADEKLQLLQVRLLKLDRLKTASKKILDKVSITIKKHKKEMIERIRIPFYIYSGKILQSYQQGLGIFIDIEETNQKNRVRFITGHASDHDVVYHLSSGQMSVVAIAFCLSLNKVYNVNNHFKFLAIDDPIQTMDDLNVHTFIELLRNDFQDYQIIFSTHDDFTSKYIKYKFDKLDFKTNIKNIQQIILEQTFSRL